MPDHTIVNLRDVEDQASKFGLPPSLEATGSVAGDVEMTRNWWTD